MHLTIRYVTRFAYPMPVWESHNAVRACPADLPTQRLLRYSIETRPAAGVMSYRDRWGTRVDSFGIIDRHSELVVIATSEVETSPLAQPAPVSRSALDGRYRDRAWQYLQRTRHTDWGQAVAEAAAESVDGVDGLLDAVDLIQGRVQSTMAYAPGTTEIGVDVEDVWRAGSGVCQDFAHVTIAMLRSIGIGARYVSGYFFAADPTSVRADDMDEIVVATHAWVEVALPDGGWWGIDPTNAASAGERHVKIGHGRDYDDVTPVRGVYYGDTGHVAAAEVTMAPGVVRHRALPQPDEQEYQQMLQQ